MEPYLIYKTLHVFGVVMFAGNIAVTGWWKFMADRTLDPKIIGFAQCQVTLTDYVFTAGGIVLMIAGGLGAAHAGGLPLTATPWIVSGSALFVLSGVIWIAVLIPLQTKLAHLSRGFASGSPIPDSYWRLGFWWNVFGVLATLLPLAAIAVMVGKVG